MAKTTASQPPTRVTSGFQTDPPFGPLADSGMLNPFFYHQVADDFDKIDATLWSGTPTAVPGDGGLVSVTGALTTANPGFLLPDSGANPPATAGSAKKIFFLARVMLATAPATGFIAGFGATGAAYANPPTVDGLYFVKPAGQLVLNVVNVVTAANSPSGVAQTRVMPVPLAAVLPVLINNQWFDIGFQIDRNQNMYGYLGQNLVGWIPQSGTDGTTVGGTPLIPTRGKIFANYNWLAQNTGLMGNVATPVMYTRAPVGPTLAASGGAVQLDFMCVQKER